MIDAFMTSRFTTGPILMPAYWKTSRKEETTSQYNKQEHDRESIDFNWQHLRDISSVDVDDKKFSTEEKWVDFSIHSFIHSCFMSNQQPALSVIY